MSDEQATDQPADDPATRKRRPSPGRAADLPEADGATDEAPATAPRPADGKPEAASSHPIGSDPTGSETIGSEPMDSEPIDSEPIDSDPTDGMPSGAAGAPIDAQAVAAVADEPSGYSAPDTTAAAVAPPVNPDAPPDPVADAPAAFAVVADAPTGYSAPTSPGADVPAASGVNGTRSAPPVAPLAPTPAAAPAASLMRRFTPWVAAAIVVLALRRRARR